MSLKPLPVEDSARATPEDLPEKALNYHIRQSKEH